MGKLEATKKAAELLAKRGVIKIWPETAPGAGRAGKPMTATVKKIAALKKYLSP